MGSDQLCQVLVSSAGFSSFLNSADANHLKKMKLCLKHATYLIHVIIKVNVIIDAHDSIKVIRFNIFEAFLEEAVFPEKLEIAEVIPVLKKSEKENVEN